jgi:predicted NBD/HSP70 family sugar kinase
MRDIRSHDISGAVHPAAGQGADLRMMRELNRLLVLNCVREDGPLARVQIAARTGLSRTTVSSIVDALLKDGLVREGNLLNAAPAGGRRAILVHFHADAGFILGVDVGRSHFTVIATNLAASVVASHSGPFDAKLGPGVCLALLTAELRSFAERNRIPWDRIVGIGVGIPGPLDVRRRMLVAPPRMPGWDRIDIRAILSRDLEVPVFLDNDANMGALGESRFGAGRGVDQLTYVKVGTGIGCGLVINSSVYRGSCGSAGELGHVSIDADGPPCECGNRGCLEAVAGALAIVQRATSPDGDSSVALADVSDVVCAARNGHVASRAALEAAGNAIGVALAGLVNLVNPAVIIIAGGVAHAGDLLLEPIRSAIATRGLAIASSQTRVVIAELGDNAIALGAVATVIEAAFTLSSSSPAPARSHEPLLAPVMRERASPSPVSSRRAGDDGGGAQRAQQAAARHRR